MRGDLIALCKYFKGRCKLQCEECFHLFSQAVIGCEEAASVCVREDSDQTLERISSQSIAQRSVGLTIFEGIEEKCGSAPYGYGLVVGLGFAGWMLVILKIFSNLDDCVIP